MLIQSLRAEPARPRWIANWPHAHWLAVGSVCLGAFMGQLDASIVTLTFPALGTEFGSTLAAVQWVSLSYLLTLVALLAPVGRLADTAGRKLVYLYGFGVFTLASAACGLADSLPALIAFRVVQAIGAAMLQANSVALVTTSAPRERMRLALGVQAAAQALGLALGPTVGGLLVAGVGWRWVFGVNVPIGIVAIIAGRYLLPRTRQRTPAGAPDWWGVALLATSASALLLALSSASGLPLPPTAVGALFVLGVLTAVGFVWRQRRARSPLIDLDLLRHKATRYGLVAATLGYLVLFGPLVLVPAMISSPLRAGLALTSLPAGFALAATLGGRFVPATWSERRRCLLGSLLCCAALATLCAGGPLVGALALLGVGLGLVTPANNALVMAAIPARCSGLGGGLVNMARGLGTTLGVSVTTLALHLTGESWPAFAALLVAAAAMAVVFLTDSHRSR
ncbi:MFS transporter [Kutzneria viridogrisea]|uniref:Major facilitator superfamily (MFS) profile domain-containing protein n=2 Tax=Kutzneria TaxID=43356 RepID=W5W9S6_9PSEU|nr:MFS transporter [Kutzneria albida]AHH97883.1 hypothetical protein KALB_4521 [Kutzneria albida DSM 43870]MBA8924464.1 EmrB/QacA subfamily drug resistance transporter [Kutzneria viridogrisea]